MLVFLCFLLSSRAEILESLRYMKKVEIKGLCPSASDSGGWDSYVARGWEYLEGRIEGVGGATASRKVLKILSLFLNGVKRKRSISAINGFFKHREATKTRLLEMLKTNRESVLDIFTIYSSLTDERLSFPLCLPLLLAAVEALGELGLEMERERRYDDAASKYFLHSRLLLSASEMQLEELSSDILFMYSNFHIQTPALPSVVLGKDLVNQIRSLVGEVKQRRADNEEKACSSIPKKEGDKCIFLKAVEEAGSVAKADLLLKKTRPKEQESGEGSPDVNIEWVLTSVGEEEELREIRNLRSDVQGKMVVYCKAESGECEGVSEGVETRKLHNVGRDVHSILFHLVRELEKQLKTEDRGRRGWIVFLQPFSSEHLPLGVHPQDFVEAIQAAEVQQRRGVAQSPSLCPFNSRVRFDFSENAFFELENCNYVEDQGFFFDRQKTISENRKNWKSLKTFTRDRCDRTKEKLERKRKLYEGETRKRADTTDDQFFHVDSSLGISDICCSGEKVECCDVPWLSAYSQIETFESFYLRHISSCPEISSPLHDPLTYGNTSAVTFHFAWGMQFTVNLDFFSSSPCYLNKFKTLLWEVSDPSLGEVRLHFLELLFPLLLRA